MDKYAVNGATPPKSVVDVRIRYDDARGESEEEPIIALTV